MDVKVKVGVLTAKAEIVQAKTTVEINYLVNVPVVSYFTFTPVISIGGTSISSITPDFNLLGVRAAA
jgi:hypothetical protein